MVNSFNSVNEDRRQSIIKNSITLFGSDGIKKTSLNSILKHSGLSKGFFYHYFKNKDEFVKYLIEFCIKKIVETLNAEKILSETDFIKRLQIATLHKTIVSMEYPYTFEFLTDYYLSITPEEYMKIANAIGGDLSKRILSENIDYSLFKDDTEIEVSMKVVSRYMAQVTEELKKQVHIMSYKEMAEHYTNELEDLRKVIYKKGV